MCSSLVAYIVKRVHSLICFCNSYVVISGKGGLGCSSSQFALCFGEVTGCSMNIDEITFSSYCRVSLGKGCCTFVVDSGCRVLGVQFLLDSIGRWVFGDY